MKARCFYISIMLLLLCVLILTGCGREAGELMPTLGLELGGDPPEDFQMPELEILPKEEPQLDFPYDPDKPTLVLTFDDGPNASLTPFLVDELNARGVHASFFVLGNNAALNHEVIDLEYASGHDVCSHGYDHQSKLTQLNDEQLAYQLDETAQVVREITGHDPIYLRPPYGAIDRATAVKINVPLMLWTIDPRDWESRDAAQVRDNIVNGAFDGGVVICHDQYESTVQGVLEAVDILLEQGWQFLSLSQYYQVISLEPQPGQVYRGSNLADLK